MQFPPVEPPKRAHARAVADALAGATSGVALGRLGALGAWVASAQGRDMPQPFTRARSIVVAGNHGIAARELAVDPDDAGRQQVRDQLDEHHDRGRGLLGGLDHDGVARGQRGRQLPTQLQNRVVPRRDQHTHTDRLVHHRAAHRLGDELAGDLLVVVELASLVRIEAEHVGDVVNVNLAFVQRFSRVKRLNLRELGLVLLEEVCIALQERTALLARLARPVGCVEKLPRGRNRTLGILGTGLVDLSEHLRVVRVDRRARLATAGRRPLAVNEQRRSLGDIDSHFHTRKLPHCIRIGSSQGSRCTRRPPHTQQPGSQHRRPRYAPGGVGGRRRTDTARDIFPTFFRDASPASVGVAAGAARGASRGHACFRD